MKALGISTVVLAALCAASAALAEPAENIDPNHHPNLAKAQHLMRQAFDELSVAQKANNDKLSGHARRAKELLEQAAAETKEAALSAGK